MKATPPRAFVPACLLLVALAAAAAGPPPARPSLAGSKPAPTTQPGEKPATPPASQPEAPPPPKVQRFTGQVLGNIEKTRFAEPSGIVFHPTRKTLFLIGDQGDICEMRTDGKLLRKRHFASDRPRLDLEGVTVDPATGLVYVAIEGAEGILEVDPKDLSLRRTFRIERTFKGKVVMAAGGQGIEAITFVPNPKHPHGGTFLVANQSFSLRRSTELSAVFEVEAPLKGNARRGAPAKILRYFSLGVTDLSGLHYDAARNRLLVLSDANNLLFEVSLAGKVITRHTNLPGQDQEGVTLDEAGHLYLAQDCGGVIKIKWERPRQ